VDELGLSYSELESVNETLRNKIEELHHTKTALSQKEHLALIGETVSKISHEIQNKISGVSVWVQNLEFAAEDDETIQEYISEIKSALNSFMDMLANFKRFYREPELNLTEFEINNFLESVVQQFNGQAKSNRINLKLLVDKSCGMLIADKEHIEQALSNLILNAIFYAPKSSEISVECALMDSWLKISVTDQGPGIQDSVAEKIYQPFFTTKTSGSGLGLAMIHSIVTAHLGTIHFENLPENGTCFTLKIPLRPGNHNY